MNKLKKGDIRKIKDTRVYYILLEERRDDLYGRGLGWDMVRIGKRHIITWWERNDWIERGAKEF